MDDWIQGRILAENREIYNPVTWLAKRTLLSNYLKSKYIFHLPAPSLAERGSGFSNETRLESKERRSGASQSRAKVTPFVSEGGFYPTGGLSPSDDGTGRMTRKQEAYLRSWDFVLEQGDPPASLAFPASHPSLANSNRYFRWKGGRKGRDEPGSFLSFLEQQA